MPSVDPVGENQALQSPFARPEYQQAKTAAYTASQTAAQTAANATELPDALRSAVAERFQESPLHGQFEGAAQNFLTAVPQKRVDLASMVQGGGPILSPNQQQSILAGTRAASMVPMISLNDLIQSQTGTMADLIGAGTRAYTAQGQRQLSAAEILGQFVNDLLNQFVTEEQMRQTQQSFGLQKGLGIANIELEQRSLAQQAAQFEATNALNKLLGLEGIAVDREQLSESARQFDLEAQLKKLTGGTKQTESEKKSQTVDDLRSDIRVGATLQQVMQAYSDDLTTSEILQQYNVLSPYGPAKESEWDLYSRYNIIPPAESRTPAQPTQEEPKTWKNLWGIL